ncbi:zinc finger FYVE domain-containing protein 1 [Octopus sinensis]|uniref:Zinc finger FYVE domain-containing protein 1 n=1 Tax=Octopus sinensis TaxID=2607531 RepID=A0A6P7SWZ2_9MOLL|nr:zinc finger FYVE domain-containing protein 1 [Octopus sinensis]
MMIPRSSSSTTASSKVRSSREFCQERLCCPQDRTEADFRCDKCGTLQCKDCEKTIHHNSKFVCHERQPLAPPPSSKLCASSFCDNKNYADVRCEDCQLNLCYQCNEALHRSNSRRCSHRRLRFRDYEKKAQQPTLVSLVHPTPNTSSLPQCSDQSQPATLLLQTTSNNNNSTISNTASAATVFTCNPIIKPLSPIGDNDDSLTYVTLPQELAQTLPETEMSFSSAHSDSSIQSIPDVCINEKDMATTSKEVDKKLPQTGSTAQNKNKVSYDECVCFKLVDEEEKLLIESEEDLLKRLGCNVNCLVKVISIFGNTGDGKSHTLNHTFFHGKEVFPTSTSQDSCTIGVWAAYDPINKAVIIDTEGMLGVTKNQNQRTRLLLKVLAVSDIVIYRTRAERLHNDLFYFLGDASNAYGKHFAEELKAANKRCNLNLSLSTMGPSVIIFHETMHTKVLRTDGNPIEMALRERFKKLDCSFESFSDLKYVGIQTQVPPTDFGVLRRVVQEQLNNRSIRSPRKPEIIFKVLKVLNGKFSGEIEKPDALTFPDQYFTCTSKCLSCSTRCIRSMNHELDHLPHETEKGRNCQYQHQYENKVYLCKQCYFKSGKNIVVVPKTSASSDNAWLGFAKYVWSGYVLECPNCGIIYRSHEYWYGNQDIEQVVQVMVSHIWPGDQRNMQGAHNAARKLLDGLHYVADTVTSVGAKPTKVLADWMTDQIAPSYWIPNALIAHCTNCEKLFEGNEQKHHCRACGKGFCDSCSSHKDPVPERGWGDTLVRTCDKCHLERNNVTNHKPSTSPSHSTPVTARKVGEVLGSTIGAVASIVDYPLGIIKDSVRPAYWIPDETVTQCAVCNTEFGPKVSKHHCRDCGKVVCHKCSPNKYSVPHRGWDYPVRVCQSCEGNSSANLC